MSDRIEKSIELKAPVSRVWRALTDHREFGTWFRVRLDGPFVPGQVSRGPENGARAAVLVHLASLRDRSEPGLLR
jgi:uncharacterized protein YndB with AHSA1/START domain